MSGGRKGWLVPMLAVLLCAAMFLALFYISHMLYQNKLNTVHANDSQVSAGADAKESALFTEAEEMICAKMNEAMVPGLSVAVVKGGETLYVSGFGYADLDTKKPATSQTLFQLASNSKAITALGVLKLQMEGRIRLNDQITAYIPWLTLRYEGEEAGVTIEQLLHHTSGIPSYTISLIPELSKENDNAIAQTVETLIDFELENRPGERYEYATINYDVLGLLIETVTGLTYEEYVQENVLNPAGLDRTYLYKSRVPAGELATGYRAGFMLPMGYDAPAYEGNKPAGYIMSNAADMAEWLKLQLGTQTEAAFDEALIQESHIPDLGVGTFGERMSYAAGWIVYERQGTEVLHSGSNPNFSSFLVFRPQEQLGVAVLCNMRSSAAAEIAQSVLALFSDSPGYPEVGPDFNLVIDRICVVVILALLFGLILGIGPFVRSVAFIYRNNETLWLKSNVKIVKIALMSVFFVGLNLLIDSLPYLLLNQVSWDYIFVWYPVTVQIGLYLLYGCIWLVYLNILMNMIKKEAALV